MVGDSSLPFLHELPIHVSEPLAVFDESYVAPAPLRVVVEQALQKLANVRIVNRFHADILSNPPLLEFREVLSVVGRESREELVEERTQGIVVAGIAVGVLPHHLRGHVLQAAAIGVGDFVL